MTHNKFLIIAILVFITTSGLSFYFKTTSYFKNSNLAAVSSNLVKESKKFVIDKKDKIILKELSEKQIKVLFVGDVMMDRFIRKQSEKLGYDFYFTCASSTFKKYDFVVANLESPVTNNYSVSFDKTLVDYNNFKFTIDPAALTAIKNAGINVVGLDNNHVYDQGKDGINLTRQNILVSGLNYFGDPLDPAHYNLRLEKDGIVFNLVSFNEFFGSTDKTLKNIGKAKGTGDLQNVATFNHEPTIIFAHWGDEYVPTPNRVKNWAHLFIDNGADLIIGMHPHVTQETETYQNKFIAYSLGNFLFDQYFSPEVQKGGAVEMILNKDGIVSSRFLNVSLDEQKRPCIIE